MQAVLVADAQHPAQVAADDAVGILIAVARQMGPQAHAVGLVHAQMDPPGAVGGGGGTDHLIQQLIGLVQVGQQHLVVVPQVVIGGPVEDALQVPQGLDAGAQLNAEETGVVVQRLQLVIGIAAPLVAEEGLAGDLVGVLGVHHAQVQAHQRHLAEEEPQGLGLEHRVAGAVEHDAGGLEAGLLADRAGRQGQGDQAHRPVKLDGRGPGQGDAFSVALHRQLVAGDAGDVDARLAQLNAQVLTQLRKRLLPVLRGSSENMQYRFHTLNAPCL